MVHGDGTPVSYKLLQCGAVQGRKACARLMKLLGPALERGAQKKDAGVEVALTAALAGLTDQISEADMDYFCELMAQHTMVNGQLLTTSFDEHFAGKPFEMMKWLVAALHHNFGSFLAAAGITGDLEKLQAAVKEQASLK